MTTADTLDSPSPVVEAVPARRRRGGELWWALPGAALGALVMWIAYRALIDDAYITLAYAKNLVVHGHWGLIPGVEANTATSPLNVVLIAFVTRLIALVGGGIRPVLGLGLLTVALTAAMAVWTAQIARRIGVSGAWSLVVLVLVFANPFVNSALGLEVVPVAAVLTGLAAQAVHGRRVWFGVLAGLAVLTRLDLGIIVALMYLLTPALLGRRWWVSPVVGLAVSLPWFAFSWWHFGSAIPTTFVIKTLQKSFGDATFANGLWKFWEGGLHLPVALAVVPAVIGLVTAVAWLVAGVRRRLAPERWPLIGLALGGAAYFAAYCVIRVPPYHWYYAAPTVAPMVTGVLGLALGLRRLGGRIVLRTAWPVATAVVAAVLAVVSFGGRTIPWTTPVLFGNWALPSDYLAVGRDVGKIVGNATVTAPPELGTVAYACGCDVVDVFSDPGLDLPLIQQRIAEAGPVGRFLLKANFHHLDRGRRPLQPTYQLGWTQGPVPAGVLRTWPTHAPGTGPATMYLQRIG